MREFGVDAAISGMAWLLARTPEAGRFRRQRVEVVRAVDPFAEVNERFEARGWTDGLPVVPPTLARVQALCATTARMPTDELGGRPAAWRGDRGEDRRERRDGGLSSGTFPRRARGRRRHPRPRVQHARRADDRRQTRTWRR
jgi:hypothetical protein